MEVELTDDLLTEINDTRAMFKKWKLPPSQIPQPKDSRFSNQVELMEKFKGFRNPIEEESYTHRTL